jgi:Protein of unknown function (DUF3370)/S-layer homology domain
MSSSSFSDIQTHWAKECILQLRSRNLISGYPDGKFYPNSPVTRAEFAVLMCNVFPGAPAIQRPSSFPDVAGKHWAEGAIQKATERGFFAGYPNGLFQPDRAIVRVQAIIVLAAYLKLKFPALPEKLTAESLKFLRECFDDADTIPQYARSMMAAATQGAIVVNYPQVRQLNPNQNATRGEVAALLCRVLGIYTVPVDYIAGITVQFQSVRSLPGSLNTHPTFNSNSPELFQTEGILLSTFPPDGKKVASAHLNFPFSGKFDLFTHHLTRRETESDRQSFYQGLVLHNPTAKKVTVEILSSASYLGNPDAPFIELAEKLENAENKIYSGPGSRTTGDIVLGRRLRELPEKIEIAPQQNYLLLNFPIPVSNAPASNGRSTLIRASSNDRVYIANLAMKAPVAADGKERAPTLEEWLNVLQNSGLAAPRDRTPTPLEPEVILPITFSRVSGVSQGTQWLAKIVDRANASILTIPPSTEAFSYALNTLHKITLGTEQIQSARMLVRYPDTAYFAHGNYGLEYNLTLPLYNPFPQMQVVTVTFSSPLKDSEHPDHLLFLKVPDRIMFRGTIRITYQEDGDRWKTEIWHLAQRRGQEGQPLLTLRIPPAESRTVNAVFFYPADCTPPHVLTVKTLASTALRN